MATIDENNWLDDLVRILRACTPNMIIEGFVAALDVDDLEKIAAGLDELILYLRKCEPE
jgi:hypothetical protein